MTAVSVRDLGVDLDAGSPVVDGVSFDVGSGEILAIVGESGAGKTTIALALLGHARRGTSIARGQVTVCGKDVLRLPPRDLRRLRGATIAYVPQDPATALNPALSVATHLSELHRAHGSRIGPDQAVDALLEVGLPADRRFLRRLPHQLSGGQQQRVCIALALALSPRVIVLDEPTTALDAVAQASALEMLRDLCVRRATAAVHVTHDLAAARSVADRVLVVYAGRVAEVGPVATVLGRPGHPYTRRLLMALPRRDDPVVLTPIPGRTPPLSARSDGCAFAPRCELRVPRCQDEAPAPVAVTEEHRVACFRTADVPPPVRAAAPLRAPGGDAERSVLDVDGLSFTRGPSRVLEDVTLRLTPGECLALVGESGAGKTTLARCIIGLQSAWSGEIRLDGRRLERSLRDRPVAIRRAMQYVFQNPYGSLNPRVTAGGSVAVPLRQFERLRGGELRRRVLEALDAVTLLPAIADAHPDELSGGERQLVAIARALAAGPRLLICDEVTSSLDLSAQAAIVDVIERLRRRRRLSILFITHDIALARAVADSALVVAAGRVVERGPAERIFVAPQATHTRELLTATPDIEGGCR